MYACMNVLGPPELGHSPPLHLAQLTMEVSKSLWVVIYGRKILCFIGIFLAHNEHHSFVHFCWKWGLPCEALCIGVFFISNFCFVHVQRSMNSRTCTTRCERALYFHPSWLQLPSPRKQLWSTPQLLNQISQKLELQSLRSTKKSCIRYLTHTCFGSWSLLNAPLLASWT